MEINDYQFLFGYENTNVLPFVTKSDSLDVIRTLLAKEKLLVIKGLEDYRHSVREIIKDRTRFNPYEYSKLGKPFSKISINVTDHVPTSIEQLFQGFPPFIIELLLKRQTIYNNIKILENLSNKEKIQTLKSFLKMNLKTSETDYQSVSSDYIELDKRLNEFANNLKGLFKERDADVFGSYNTKTHEINLYWVSIALYSNVKNLDIDKITFIVLAHELAHLYTHIGLDINGRRWEDYDFRFADNRITEGLAEFHSFESCRKASRELDLLRVYANLLVDAPEQYQAWLKHWYNNSKIEALLNCDDEECMMDLVKELKALPDIGEKVRYSTMRAREKNKDFENFLVDISKEEANRSENV